MTLDEAIKYAEEEAEEQDKLCKRYDDASSYSRSHNEAIRTTDAKRCEKCADNHRQLAEWLKDYKRLKEQEPKTGHWIEDTNGTYTDNHDTWECSECGHAQILLEGTPKDNDYNYCPNCGACMKDCRTLDEFIEDSKKSEG